MGRNVVFSGIAATLLLMCGRTGLGQDTLLEELYGQGVHAYFARDFAKAVDSLSAAIDQGSKDPRCYYFRGLAYHHLGRPEQAEQDFAKGGELEVSQLDRFYPVSLSLQRIQGELRLQIEQHRQEARVAARLRALKAKQARYEQRVRAEQEVLRKPDAQLPPEAEELLPATPPEDSTDPFAKEAPPAMEKAPPKPTIVSEEPAEKEESVTPPAEKPAAPAADNPFGTPPASGEAKPADTPFGENPFGEPAEPKPSESGGGAAPPASKPAETPTQDDPFGTSTPPAADESQPEKPASEQPASEEDDPFGAGAASEPNTDAPVEEPAEEKPAPKTDDPFADDPFSG